MSLQNMLKNYLFLEMLLSPQLFTFVKLSIVHRLVEGYWFPFLLLVYSSLGTKIIKLVWL